MSYLVGPRVNYLVFYSSLETPCTASAWTQYHYSNLVPLQRHIAGCQTTQQCGINAFVAANLKPDTVLMSLNVPLNFVYIISWVRFYAVWTIHEGLHGIFSGAPVQLGLIPHPWLHRCRFDVIRGSLRRINTQTINFKHLVVKHILTWLILGEYATTFHFNMWKFSITIFN